VHGLVGTRWAGTRRAGRADAPGTSRLEAPDGRADRPYLRFVVLTAVNPLTVVAFTSVAAGMAARLDGLVARAAFVVGIGAASAAWQLCLAGAGALLGARVSDRVRTVLSAAGYGVVAALAIALATG